MAIPIIAVHCRYVPYLLHVLTQEKSTNSKSEVILLGDSDNSIVNFATHRNTSDSFEEAREFEELYQDKHRSSNPYEYELICFQRWSVLKEFMQKNYLERAVHNGIFIAISLAIRFRLSTTRLRLDCCGN